MANNFYSNLPSAEEDKLKQTIKTLEHDDESAFEFNVDVEWTRHPSLAISWSTVLVRDFSVFDVVNLLRSAPCDAIVV